VGTPVSAALAGRVTLSADFFFFGGLLVVDHGHGVNTLYAHLSSAWWGGGGGRARPAHRADGRDRPGHRPAPALLAVLVPDLARPAAAAAAA
jgi:hypothetical protein